MHHYKYKKYKQLYKNLQYGSSLNNKLKIRVLFRNKSNLNIILPNSARILDLSRIIKENKKIDILDQKIYLVVNPNIPRDIIGKTLEYNKDEYLKKTQIINKFLVGKEKVITLYCVESNFSIETIIDGVRALKRNCIEIGQISGLANLNITEVWERIAYLSNDEGYLSYKQYSNLLHNIILESHPPKTKKQLNRKSLILVSNFINLLWDNFSLDHYQDNISVIDSWDLMSGIWIISGFGLRATHNSNATREDINRYILSFLPESDISYEDLSSFFKNIFMVLKTIDQVFNRESDIIPSIIGSYLVDYLYNYYGLPIMSGSMIETKLITNPDIFSNLDIKPITGSILNFFLSQE